MIVVEQFVDPRIGREVEENWIRWEVAICSKFIFPRNDILSNSSYQLSNLEASTPTFQLSISNHPTRTCYLVLVSFNLVNSREEEGA